jgi:threonine dehydratase
VSTIDPDAIARAAERLAPYVRRTPLMHAEHLGEGVAFKAEHLQRSSSFKFRGALNRLLVLDDADRRRGVITASTGNHGIGVATAGRQLGIPVSVRVARGTDDAIVEHLRGLGAEVATVDSDDPVDGERAARREAEADGRTFVSPYNDPAVVAGQGTIAVELLDQLGELDWDAVDAVTVAVGGGGLIAGIATWLAHAAPSVRVIGAQPAADAAMTASVRAGRVVEVEAGETLSHSTAGGLEEDTVTLAPCRAHVHEWAAVAEADIADAVRTMILSEHQLVEGAAGVALAAARDAARRDPGTRVLAISCGARLTPGELRRVLDGVPAAGGDPGTG